MIPQLVVLVVLLGAVSQGMAGCQNKPPMKDYSGDLVSGKYYLLALKVAFHIQTKQLQCGTYSLASSDAKTFPFLVTYQTPCGSITKTVNMTNLSPPGTLHVNTGTEDYQASVIGAIKDKVNIYYGCNTQTGNEAVWIDYYKRVTRASEVDGPSLDYTLQTLSQNQISLCGFQLVNNTNCND